MRTSALIYVVLLLCGCYIPSINGAITHLRIATKITAPFVFTSASDANDFQYVCFHYNFSHFSNRGFSVDLWSAVISRMNKNNADNLYTYHT